MNIAFVVSNLSKVKMFEWISVGINQVKFNPVFIFLNDSRPEAMDYLEPKGFKCELIYFKTKKDILFAFFKMVKILLKYKVNIIHTHLFEASLIGLFSAYILRIPKRIHTRHHSDFHHIYHPKSVKYDNFINFLSTNIIAISKNVESLLIYKERYTKNKIELIYHGFKLSEFTDIQKVETNKIKIKWGIKNESFVIGMVSRLIKWKSVDFAIMAFKELLILHPESQLVIANAVGEKEYLNYIQQLICDIPKDKIVLIKYENNMPALYKSFDVFLHVPEDETCEAFGQVYIEAMASSIPCVVTKSGIAVEYINHLENAIVVNYNDSKSILDGLEQLINNESKKLTIAKNGFNSVQKLFSLENMILNLEKLYLKNND